MENDRQGRKEELAVKYRDYFKFHFDLTLPELEPSIKQKDNKSILKFKVHSEFMIKALRHFDIPIPRSELNPYTTFTIATNLDDPEDFNLRFDGRTDQQVHGGTMNFMTIFFAIDQDFLHDHVGMEVSEQDTGLLVHVQPWFNAIDLWKEYQQYVDSIGGNELLGVLGI